MLKTKHCELNAGRNYEAYEVKIQYNKVEKVMNTHHIHPISILSVYFR